jgi:RNA polymerase sigma-70 factor (ECF subfamily)
VLLGDQDRDSWDKHRIQRATFHIEKATAGEHLTAFHLEAKIAALHTMSPSFEETNWGLIANTYDSLYKIRQTPVVALNRAVAYAQLEGPRAGLEKLEEHAVDEALKRYCPYYVTVAVLQRQIGNFGEALAAFEKALKCPASQPMKNHIKQQMQQLTDTQTAS